ncbi:MAG: S8 family serine peptidase [bacterium]|nr:S8 family serine peptidase [bacterium]
MPKTYHIFLKIATFLVICVIIFPVLALAKIPNDPDFQSAMWEQINAPMAWDYSVGTKKVTVAVIDTGADNWHEDLTENIWTNYDEIADNGNDDDGNGYIDDIHGWNFIENNNDTRTSVFNAIDDHKVVNHGTVISGLVGAVGDNGRDGVGVNWRVKIMPLRAVDSEGRGSVKNVIYAINYAADNGADVISLSFVTEFNDDTLTDTLREAYERGIIIVAAAGNARVDGNGDLDVRPLYPVCADKGSEENWIIGVSAVDGDDHLSRFADYGSCVDIVAPGENVFSTERYAPSYGYLQTFGGDWSGTSFSVPMVAGAAALVKSVRPDCGAKEIIKNLLRGATNIDNKNFGMSGRLGAGRLNVGQSVLQAWVGRPAEADTAGIYNFNFPAGGSSFSVFNIKDKKWQVVGRVPRATILALVVADINNDKKDDQVLLIRRGNLYYIRTVNGRFLLNEFVVEGAGSKMPASDLSIFDDGRENYFFAVTLRDTVKKKTVLRKYGADGVLLAEIKLNWLADVCRAGWNDGVVCAVKEKGAYKLVEVDWSGVTLRTINLGKGDSVDSFGVGLGVNGNAAAVVIRTGRQTTLKLIDLTSGNVISKVLAKVSAPAKWQIVFGHFGGQRDVLVYNSKGGKFGAYDVGGRVVMKVNLNQF